MPKSKKSKASPKISRYNIDTEKQTKEFVTREWSIFYDILLKKKLNISGHELTQMVTQNLNSFHDLQ